MLIDIKKDRLDTVVYFLPRLQEIVVSVASVNIIAHIGHQCRKTTVLRCHRCLIDPGNDKMNIIEI
jgi:hypothetical protein